jgi:channel protein (hemolysin III family)
MDGTVSIAGIHEPFASLIHLLAALVVLWRGAGLVRYTTDVRECLGLSAFVFGAVAMFALSGTYHLLDPTAPARAVLQRLDHAAIWVMIAGSFSAVHAVAFRGIWRWGFLALVWTIAISGLVLKTVFFTALPESAGLALYLVLGWMGIATIVQSWRYARWSVARLLLLSGIAYSAGAVYDFAAGPAPIPGVLGAHEVFHLAVIVGVALHWGFVRSLMGVRTSMPPGSRLTRRRPRGSSAPDSVPASFGRTRGPAAA